MLLRLEANFKSSNPSLNHALAPLHYLHQQPVINSEEWRKAPLTYALCEKDQAIPPDHQLSQGMETVKLNPGHLHCSALNITKRCDYGLVQCLSVLFSPPEMESRR